MSAFYGYIAPEEPVQLVTFRIEATGIVEKVQIRRHERTATPLLDARIGQRGVWMPETRGEVECPLYDRTKLGPGHVIDGPAIVEQMDSTTLLLPGQRGCRRSLPQSRHRGGSGMSRTVDPITVEVIGNAVSSIVEEMGETLIRASYSTNIKERRDCSTALFDAKGRTLAQAEHIPIHLGSFIGVIDAILERTDSTVEDCDTFVGNDAYTGGGTHLPDIVRRRLSSSMARSRHSGQPRASCRLRRPRACAHLP
ncbi:MAG: hydantoinase B/oxoprolinase family protein [Geminicoccaceae bacterium]